MSDYMRWTTRPGVLPGEPRRHLGARPGEHPRYVIQHERRSGALFWVLYYRPGTLKDIELSAAADTLNEMKQKAIEDLSYRLAVGEVPREVSTN